MSDAKSKAKAADIYARILAGPLHRVERYTIDGVADVEIIDLSRNERREWIEDIRKLGEDDTFTSHRTDAWVLWKCVRTPGDHDEICSLEQWQDIEGEHAPPWLPELTRAVWRVNGIELGATIPDLLAGEMSDEEIVAELRKRFQKNDEEEAPQDTDEPGDEEKKLETA